MIVGMILQFMTPWPIIIVPAVLLALIVRIDAKFLGPYFALSELIPGFGSELQIRSRTRNAAIIRRFLYPLITGFLMCFFFRLTVIDLISIGFIGAGLLLWPLIFHGLPYGISRRSISLIVLYLSFLGSYASLSLVGGFIVDVMREAGNGDIWLYVRESFRDWIIAALAALIFTTLVRGAENRLRRRDEP